MADKQLFPVFEAPEVLQETTTETQKFKRSYYFDYETGDFAKDGGNRVRQADGHTAWAQWCLKIVQIERYACLAYSSDIGIEMEEVRKQPTRKAAEAVLERTITEALLVHPMTESVRGFSFQWDGDNLGTEFTVYPKEGVAITINTSVTT
ncbi:DUF2634 domain-containing protein [Petroclostridium sp. X23]|uniref:DUF2634 domain-containing protein n=1 Tax=Petroclostridium sp. X23 TaxID=3045146 RepID=UPI0024ACA145|nr:DUF2634 domain-containing protein [Petroclostridium sp. X23]WHH58317.1 DUF2634 domain-containing protein [Petroclostridium sp. X23]